MNVFVAALADLCAARRLEEKRMIAPSRRVGNQWLEAAARAGRPALNVRVETLRSLAADLADPVLARAGLEAAPARAEALLVDALLRELLPGRLRYLGAAAAGPGLAGSVHASLLALRLQGIPERSLAAGAIETAEKAADLRLLAAEYGRGLERLGLADYAAVLRAATQRLAADPGALGTDALVLVPGDFAPRGLERRFLEAIPAARLVRLPVDPPGVPADVRFACAVGEGNEARAVLRACLEAGIPFDDVEVLYTDPAYALAFVEAFAAIDRPGAPAAADPVADAPATFAEGLPCALSRPGRALAAWARWMAGGYPQAALVAMLREGLLRAAGEGGEAAGEGVSFSRLAALLRSLPIGQGRERHLERIGESLRAARERLGSAPAEGDGADHEGAGEGRLEETPEERRARLARRVEELELLHGVVERLLGVSPPPDAAPRRLVQDARRFLDGCTRSPSQFDAFAAERLRDELDGMAAWLGRAGEGSAQELRTWLEALPAEARVGGSGPRPERLHLDRLRAGGHTGRGHLFVLGLDGGRFPGGGGQDPLLLDGERLGLDAEMPTAASRLEESTLAFRRLLGRQRGAVTLSWPSLDVVGDAPRFPSQAVIDVFRDARGRRDARLEDLLGEVGLPASFAPDAPERALDGAEWRLWRFTGGQVVANAGEVLARRAPDVARGADAAAQRAGTAFTAFDGRVPLAGAALDPAAPGGRVISSNGLETVGACPRRFFYRYGLALQPPEELEIDPERWLDPLETGSLLHEVFEGFVRGRVAAGCPPLDGRAEEGLLLLLAARIEVYRRRYPAPSPAVFERECALLRRAAATFVSEERHRESGTAARPAYVEATFGMPPGEHATAIDAADAVQVALPDGRTIRTRGRIDRIDRPGLPGGGWEVWDYKSGSPFGFERADPFPEGRKIQPYLYWRMVERRLREAVDPAAEVRTFGYFFPGAKGKGERIWWDAARLASGAGTLAELCAIVAAGAFAATTSADKDCAWCDYRKVCGDVQAQAHATKGKIRSGEPLLAPMGRLRGLADGGAGPAEAGE